MIPKGNKIAQGWWYGVTQQQRKGKVKLNTKELIIKYQTLHQDFINNYDHTSWEIFKTKNNLSFSFPTFKTNIKKYLKFNIEVYQINNKYFYNKLNYEKYSEELTTYYTNLYNIRKNVSSKEFIKITGYKKKVSNLPIFFKKYVKDYQ